MQKWHIRVIGMMTLTDGYFLCYSHLKKRRMSVLQGMEQREVLCSISQAHLARRRWKERNYLWNVASWTDSSSSWTCFWWKTGEPFQESFFRKMGYHEAEWSSSQAHLGGGRGNVREDFLFMSDFILWIGSEWSGVESPCWICSRSNWESAGQTGQETDITVPTDKRHTRTRVRLWTDWWKDEIIALLDEAKYQHCSIFH